MSKKLIEALNQALSRELAALTQYFWHNVMAVGMESPEIKDLFREISIEEMKHAEKFAERLNYLGGVPTTKPSQIKVGGSLKKMIQDDLEAEREAIKLYKAHIRLCIEEDDPVTRCLYEDILADEEEHEGTWTSILSK